MNSTEYEKGPMRLFAARTGAKDVVTIKGSILGGYYMLPRELRMVPRIASDIFDAGTDKRSKDSIRAALTARGASIGFSPGGDRTSFYANCLPEDIQFVVKLISECLSGATFPAVDITTGKKRTVAELEESKQETSTRASRQFSQMIYDTDHTNYPESVERSIDQTNKTSRSSLQTYRKLLGKGGLVFSITGDIHPDEVLSIAERAFSKLSEGTMQMTEKNANTKKAVFAEKRITIADKATIDMFMGAAVPINYDSPEFLAFTVLSTMLGGRGLSTGHLMRTIRERDGLTYGIYANPVGFNNRADGALEIWATFSPPTYEAAVAATLKEIKTFLTSGITEQSLQNTKDKITGNYSVGLGTSGGLAQTLHSIGMQGKPMAYIDEYVDLIQSISLSDIQNVATLVPWDSFSISAAGTFEK